MKGHSAPTPFHKICRESGVRGMSVLGEYAVMKQKMWNAIDAALIDGTVEESRAIIREVLGKNVYSYSGTPQAMRSRRYENGGLYDTNNIISSVIDIDESTHELDMENIAGFQHPAPASRLDEIIESGNENYRQPYPRPFYRDIEKAIIASGKASRQIRYELIFAGFEVE